MSATTKRTTIRVNWVSEVRNNAGRRALLLATYPAFLAWNVSALLVRVVLHLAILPFAIPLAMFRSLRRSVRILNKSLALRWFYAKPRGSDDWVSSYMDDYEASA